MVACTFDILVETVNLTYGLASKGGSAGTDKFLGFPDEVFWFTVAFLVDNVGCDFEV